jgi:hypothetical protein
MGGGGEHAYSCRSLWYSRSGMAIGHILVLLYSYIIVVWARKICGNSGIMLHIVADSEHT